MEDALVVTTSWLPCVNFWLSDGLRVLSRGFRCIVVPPVWPWLNSNASAFFKKIDSCKGRKMECLQDHNSCQRHYINLSRNKGEKGRKVRFSKFKLWWGEYVHFFSLINYILGMSYLFFEKNINIKLYIKYEKSIVLLHFV